MARKTEVNYYMTVELYFGIYVNSLIFTELDDEDVYATTVRHDGGRDRSRTRSIWSYIFSEMAIKRQVR